MKIALCGRFNTSKKHQGGSAEVFLALAKGLSKRNEVTVFGRGEPTKEIIEMCKENKIKYYYIPSDSIINILLGPLRALKLMKKHWNNFDIIHTHIGSFAWASTFFRKKSKIITHIHQYLFPKGSNIYVKIYFFLERKLLKIGAKKTNLVITVTPYIKEIIKKKWKIKNILVINNGIDFKQFKFNKKKINKSLFKILYVGRLTKQKNIDKIINAIPLVRNKIQFDIVGDGEEENSLKKLALNKDIKNVLFHGTKNKKELNKFYNISNVLLLVSDFEGQSLTLLEAMATGTPIIASNVEGTRDIIQNNYNGLLVEPTSEKIAQAIEKLIKNPQLRENLTEKGLKEVQKYSWDKIVEQTEKVYLEALNER